MNISTMKTEELALLLHGLRAVYVADQAELQQRMIKELEQALARRGCSLAA